jgi:hypothetical protein
MSNSSFKNLNREDEWGTRFTPRLRIQGKLMSASFTAKSNGQSNEQRNGEGVTGVTGVMRTAEG